MKIVSAFFLQLQSKLSISWKLRLNLCSKRWISPSRSLLRSFTPRRLWQTKILFPVGLMSFKIFDLKMLSVYELRMSKSNLFHSIMVDGKCFFKKLMLHTDAGDILCISSSYWQFDCGIKSKTYSEH